MTLQSSATQPSFGSARLPHRRRALALAVHLAAAGLVALPMLSAPAVAQEANQQQVRHYDIPAGPVGTALNHFAAQASIYISGAGELGEGRRSEGLQGEYDVEEGLGRLLDGTGLAAVRQGDGSYRLVVGSVAGASLASDAGEVALDDIVSSATRQGLTLRELTHAVTVIDREELETQLTTSRTLGDVLAKTVPGMAPSSQTLTNFNQTLRGRNALVLIDGIPQNTSRNISRDLMNIDASNIERIEVLRGGSAVYGSGAMGGVINIITRRNEPGAVSRVELSNSLSNPSSDGLGYRGEQTLGGASENADYGITLAWEHHGAMFDADGRRIAPEPSQGDLSDTDSLSLGGKVNWYLDAGTLTLSANHFDAEQDTDYLSDPAVNAFPPGSVRARAISGLQLDEQNRTRNTLLNLAWQADDTFLGALDAQLYYRDYHARFTPFDGRPYGTWNALAQSFLDSENLGGRLTLDTQLDEASRLRWGLDLRREKTEMPVTTYDGDAFDASGGKVFIDRGDRTFMPELTQDTAAAFVQLERDLGERLRGDIGVRYERADASFDDFTTLGQGNEIEGGTVEFDDVLFNAGLLYHLSDATDLYADYSQGFELPDIGLQLRYAPAGFSAGDSQLEPIKTDHYELGLRHRWRSGEASLAAFYSTSDLGKPVIDNFAFSQRRAEERIYGLEAEVQADLSEAWRAGGLLSWTEGERYNEGAERWEALNGFRIPPLQLHTFLEYRQDEAWLHRLQFNYSGARDDAFEDGVGFGGRQVEAYTTLDYAARYQSGDHTVSLGVENLLNEDYHHVYGQLLRDGKNTSHIPARGATLTLGYRYQW